MDGYSIVDYTPLALPTAGTRHLFANTTPLPASQTYAFTEAPLLRVLPEPDCPYLELAEHRASVAGTQVVTGVTAGGSEIRGNVTPVDYAVRVQVCVSTLIHLEKCKRYPSGNYKPIGLFQDYGEAAAGSEPMYFGLLSGFYAKNTSGGVLRRNIGSMRDEINVDTNGIFKSFDGIITSMNRMRSTGFGAATRIHPGHGSRGLWLDHDPAQSTRATARCGDPGRRDDVRDAPLLCRSQQSDRCVCHHVWSGPGGAASGRRLAGGELDQSPSEPAILLEAFQTVVSDINPSYDTDDLPGSAFPGAGGDDVGGLDVASVGQDIWDDEMGGSETIS